MKRMLLLSNSTLPGEDYFGWPGEHVKKFLGNEVRKIAFIPYAAVTLSYDDFASLTGKAFEQLGYEIMGVHTTDDPAGAIAEAEAIAIGGGNTFQLISKMYELGLMDVIKEKVNSGTPSIGWSAGSNMHCPSITTTNDMPVVEPPSFDALNLVPFQINPHYTEATIPGHGGESRDQRLAEFIEVNPGVRVAGLPEGALLEVIDNQVKLVGKPMKIFEKGKETRTIEPGSELTLNLD